MKGWTKKTSILLVLLCATASSAFAQSSAVEEGLSHFKAGRYQHAETYLRQAVQQNENDAEAHYYLANTLVYLGKHSEAIAEYRASYQIDSYGPVSGYCRKALDTYRAEIPDSASHNGRASAQQIAHSAIVKEYSPNVNNAVGKIRLQAELEKERHKRIADSLSNAAMSTGESAAEQIQSQARSDIDNIYNPPPILAGRARYNPLEYTPEMQKAKADEVRRSADEAAQVARAKAAQKVSAYKAWTDQHSYVLDETAANLEKQLNERTLPGTPRLAAEGTGLYVRNYMPPSEPSPYPETHAGVARIYRNSVGPQSADSGNLAEPHSLDDQNNSVRGSVIKKGD